MAGLDGAVSDSQLPNTGIKLNYAAERKPSRPPRNQPAIEKREAERK
jgi:hypothetical protein